MTGTGGASNPHVTNGIRLIAAGSEIGSENTLKVETRVRTSLGLPGETHHRRTRLHSGQAADTRIQDAKRGQTHDQAGLPHLSRPACVPQTTSPRHGAPDIGRAQTLDGSSGA
jgi:hypothetical protein